MGTRTRVLSAVAAAALGLSVLTVGGGPAGAQVMALEGIAGGTQAWGPNNQIVSDLTAETTVHNEHGTTTRSNRVADVDVLNGLVHIGAVTTSEVAKPITGGRQITVQSKSTGVRLLNSIAVSVVTTTVVIKVINGVLHTSAATTFVGVSVPNHNVPATIPKNFTIAIPGLVSLVFNSSQTKKIGDTTRVTGTGLTVFLLRSIKGEGTKGTKVWLNPTIATWGPSDVIHGLTPAGAAYGTRVDVNTGKANVASVESGPTALTTINGTTKGIDHKKSTASIDTGSLLSTGVITTIGNNNKTSTGVRATMTAEITKANLLNGLVKADLIKGSVTASETYTGPVKFAHTATLLNAKIAGVPLAANPAPNTKINILNVGIVTLNKLTVSTSKRSIVQTLIDIVITTASFGLPVGAHIEIARTGSWVMVV